MDCPCCGTKMVPFFLVPGDWRKPKKDISFEVLKCPQDGFAKVAPSPSPETLADHYDIDDYYTHSKGKAAVDTARPFLFRVIEAVAYRADHGIHDLFAYLGQLLRSSGQTRVLDIGAGAGGLITQFNKAGFEVAGIEPDENAQSRQPDFPLKVYGGSGEDIPEALGDNSFDLVVLTHVFEHVSDPMKVLSNIHGLLDDKGRVFIEIPNADCLDFKWCRLGWQHLGVPRHLNFWTARSAQAAFAKAGFVDVKIGYRNYTRQFLWTWVRFGQPILEFHRGKGRLGWTLKAYPKLYALALLSATLLSSKARRYDSLVIEASVSKA